MLALGVIRPRSRLTVRRTKRIVTESMELSAKLLMFVASIGMGVNSTVIAYILLATLIVLTLCQIGCETLVAHLFAFYFGMFAQIIPPVWGGSRHRNRYRGLRRPVGDQGGEDLSSGIHHHFPVRGQSIHPPPRIPNSRSRLRSHPDRPHRHAVRFSTRAIRLFDRRLALLVARRRGCSPLSAVRAPSVLTRLSVSSDFALTKGTGILRQHCANGCAVLVSGDDQFPDTVTIIGRSLASVRPVDPEPHRADQRREHNGQRYRQPQRPPDPELRR